MNKTINDILIEEFIETKNIIIIVFFWSNWSSPGNILEKTIKDIKIKNGKEIKIIKINIDFNYYTVEKFSVKTTPTIMIIKNKITLIKKNGILTKKYLKNIIKKI